MFKHILLPLDRYNEAHPVLEVAANTAKAFGAKITVLHSYEFLPAMPVFMDSPYAYQTELEDYLAVQSKKIITHAVEHLKNAGVTAHGQSILGEVGHNIVALVERGDFDLIVMGARELGMLKRFVVGSVSQYVLHHTHCPVLVIPDSEVDA